ncbi:MAG: glucose-6-phosphate dehydrogenase assembly protein OpcA [Nocardioidaceae bacterium]
MIDLADTTATAIAAEFVRARRRAGSPAMGMIMTIVVVAVHAEADESMAVARAASREHPARILAVVLGDGRGAARVDARVGIGSGASGERALITLTGEVTRHPESVVLPLLLPDSPVVVWWPGRAPSDPAADPIGRLGTRRITDAASAPTAKGRAMLGQCRSYAPGNTDLAWTRITGWRALLAAALDQHREKVLSASVTAERISPSADLLSAWLADRLRCEVTRGSSAGPGITEVVLSTRQGEVRIARSDGRLALMSTPGAPDRPVALKRRDLDELLSEELRRLDPDDVYAATAAHLASHGVGTAAKRARRASKGATGRGGSARRRTSTTTGKA